MFSDVNNYVLSNIESKKQMVDRRSTYFGQQINVAESPIMLYDFKLS